MVTYIKDTTDYGHYFIESDPTNNDDWITDHAGEPGEARIDLFTDGLEYIRIAMVDQNVDAETFRRMFETLVDGVTETFTVGEEANIYTIRGIFHAGTLAALYALGKVVKKFCRAHNRKSAKQAYLVNRFGATDYEPFYDENGNELKYARGYVASRVLTYNEGKLDLGVVIVWRIAWT